MNSRDTRIAEATDWWRNRSTEEERELAFIAITHGIMESAEKRGTYRHVLYDQLGFSPKMYVDGMDSGFFALNNLLSYGLDFEHYDFSTRMKIIIDSQESREYQISDVDIKLDDDLLVITAKTEGDA